MSATQVDPTPHPTENMRLVCGCCGQRAARAATNDEHVKVFVRNPESSAFQGEWLWASPTTPGRAVITNVPFCTELVNLGDTVAFDSDTGDVRRVVHRSERGLVQVLVGDGADVGSLMKALDLLGCQMERGLGVVAATIPCGTLGRVYGVLRAHGVRYQVVRRPKW